MSVNRGQDSRMNGGRARIELEYDIGFDDSGKIHALDLRLFLLGGMVMGGSTVDVFSLSGMLDQVNSIATSYSPVSLPAFHVAYGQQPNFMYLSSVCNSVFPACLSTYSCLSVCLSIHVSVHPSFCLSSLAMCLVSLQAPR